MISDAVDIDHDVIVKKANVCDLVDQAENGKVEEKQDNSDSITTKEADDAETSEKTQANEIVVVLEQEKSRTDVDTPEENDEPSTKEVATDEKQDPPEVNAEDDDGFDDDDFGDFEEATAEPSSSFTAPEPVHEPEPQPQPARFADFRRFSQSSFDSTLLSICDILENSSVWLFDHVFDENPVDFCDILPLLDTGSSSTEDELLEPFKKALFLWTQICYVEETAALKFSWQKSVSYTKLLGSLNMSKEKAYAKSKDLPIFAQHLISSQNILKPVTPVEKASTSETPTNPPLPSSSPSNHEFDSLSVEPVNFDWQSSGLSNPLTGADLKNFVAIRETDFLASLENGTYSKTNGSISMLDQDLQALGLVDEKPSSSMQGPSFTEDSKNPFDLVLQNSHSNDDISAQTRRPNKPISELSPEARELLLELPDYSYMLANVLMFPVVNR